MINDIIKSLRKARGLTQSELAERLNLSQSTIASWENGTRRPDLDFLPILARFFGVSVDTLLGNPMQYEEDDETWAIRERLRRDPEYRMLFSAAENATPEHLRAAAAMLKALEPPTFPDEEPQEFPE